MGHYTHCYLSKSLSHIENKLHNIVIWALNSWIAWIWDIINSSYRGSNDYVLYVLHLLGEKRINYTHNIYIYVNIGILPPDVMYKIDALVIKFETASREPNILYANIMMHHYAFDYAVNRLVKHISQRNMSIALFLHTNHNYDANIYQSIVAT